MSNPFDQFDGSNSSASNPFDQFDSSSAAKPKQNKGIAGDLVTDIKRGVGQARLEPYSLDVELRG